MGLRSVTPLTDAAILQAAGTQFNLEPGVYLVSCPGLAGAETANVEVHIGEEVWVPVNDIVNADATPQMDATTPYHYMAGGGRFRAYKTATVAETTVKVQKVAHVIAS